VAKKVIITGAGLGGLSTALRLAHQGYEVEILEQHERPGGRLNLLKKDGFTFDIGPSFFSMSYEFRELFDSIGEPIPFELNELNPLYTVNIEGRDKVYRIFKDLEKLALEFKDIEPDFERKAEKYLKRAGEIFHDTEYRIIKKNFNGMLPFLLSMATVPKNIYPRCSAHSGPSWSAISKAKTLR